MKRFFVAVMTCLMLVSNAAAASDPAAADPAAPDLVIPDSPPPELINKSIEFMGLSGIRITIRDVLISNVFMSYDENFDKVNPPEELKSSMQRFVDGKLIPRCALYYARTFSASELDDIIAFYKTPAGRKYAVSDAEISSGILSEIQYATDVFQDELKAIVAPFSEKQPEQAQPEPSSPEPPETMLSSPEQAGASHAVSVSFRLVEDTGSPGLEMAIDPKTGAAIFLRPEAVIDNYAVTEARVIADPVWKEPVVEITLNEAAKRKFSDFTAGNAGRRLAIQVDGKVVNAPMIRERIASGTCVISGGFSRQEAERIAAGILLPPSAPQKQAEPVYSTPEEAVQAYFAAMRDGGLGATGRLLHPEALARFREILIPLVDLKDSAGGNPVMAVFFGADATIESVRAKTPLEFYTAFMTVASVMSGMSLVNLGDFEIVGSVAEGDMVHVLVRGQASAGPITAGGMEVASLKRYGEGWKILLSKNIEGLAEALRQLGNKKQDDLPDNPAEKSGDDILDDIEDF